jgi:hypothetical protein
MNEQKVTKMRDADKNREFLVVKTGAETVFVCRYLQTMLPN